MPKASEVATELRKLADCLDGQPEAEVVKPYIWFMNEEKLPFLSLARILPRPLAKGVPYPGEHAEIRLTYQNNAVFIASCIKQSKTCEIIEPAKPAVYRCAPILSEEEDAALKVEA